MNWQPGVNHNVYNSDKDGKKEAFSFFFFFAWDSSHTEFKEPKVEEIALLCFS